MAGRELSDQMKAFREAWLSSKAIHATPKPVKFCNLGKRAMRARWKGWQRRAASSSAPASTTAA